MNDSANSQARVCVIYKSKRQDELYLFVDKTQGLEPVPEDLLASLGSLVEVMTLQITPDRKLARADAGRVLETIAGQGYFVQMPPSLHPQTQAQVFQELERDQREH